MNRLLHILIFAWAGSVFASDNGVCESDVLVGHFTAVGSEVNFVPNKDTNDFRKRYPFFDKGWVVFTSVEVDENSGAAILTGRIGHFNTGGAEGYEGIPIFSGKTNARPKLVGMTDAMSEFRIKLDEEVFEGSWFVCFSGGIESVERKFPHHAIGISREETVYDHFIMLDSPTEYYSLNVVPADQIIVTKITGYLAIGDSTPKTVILSEFRGEQFKKFRRDAEKVVQLMDGRTSWIDFGPDAGHVSVAIRLKGEIYTIYSWYPLHRDKDTVAVTSRGLVSVADRKEKEMLESQNSEEDQVLYSFLDKVMGP